MVVMTLFSASLRLVGLSQSEAADYFDVRLDTVKSWSAGRNKVPEGVWAQLRELYEVQIVAVEEAMELVREQRPAEISLNENGPRGKDWPSRGVHMAVLAMCALDPDCPPISIGSVQ